MLNLIISLLAVLRRPLPGIPDVVLSAYGWFPKCLPQNGALIANPWVSASKSPSASLLSYQIQMLIFPAYLSSSCCAFFFFSFFFLFILPSSGLVSSFFLLFVCFLFFLLAYPVMKNPSTNLALPYCITVVCQSAAYFSCLLVFFLLCIILLLLLLCSSFFWSCIFFFPSLCSLLVSSFSYLLILI